jgi:hypothetical protein
MKAIGKTALMLVTGLGAAASAHAVVITIPQAALSPSTGYYTNSLGTQAVMTGGGNAANVGGVRNDDGFRGPIPLGFNLDFFGGTYNQFWANNNGNISFTSGLAQFTPSGPQGASVPVISPFFADVDTRNAASGVMWIQNDVPDQWVITWDAVGYYGAHADRLNSFQLVLRGPAFPVPVGEGYIGFFYGDMEWETGDASGGSGGFGGTPGAVGFGDGQANGIVLEGSTADGIAAAVSNHYIWFEQNLEPVCGVPGAPPCPAPEPGLLPLLGVGLATLLGSLRRRLT